ncbi:MAG: hypothetical protein EGQ62_17000 [Bacteroides caccae]|nr:hypothetical protein [Bacteroides caccae]
MYVLVKPEKF